MNPTNVDPRYTPLKQLMQVQLQQIQVYIEYLHKVKQAITNNEHQLLNDLLSNPDIDLQDIEQTQQQLELSLVEFSDRHKEKKLEKIVKSSAQDDLIELYETYAETLKQLEKDILINELLVRKNQQHVRQSIRILSGHGMENDPGTYSRGGAAEEKNEQRPIAIA